MTLQQVDITNPTVQSLRALDKAFINSILSYAIYTKNASWFEDWAKLKSADNNYMISNEDLIAKENYFEPESRAHDRAFAAVVTSTFTPAKLNLEPQGNHFSQDYLYPFESQYKDGIYKSLDNLSAACAMKTRNTDGTYTLHMSFRGTDSKAQPFLKFLRKAYPDMKAYYESFKPFEKACLEYAQDPANNISKIELSGHSLGGAMVQHFFKSKEVKDANLSQPMEGITFGSPHAISKALYSLLPAARHMVVRGNFKNMVVTALALISGDGILKALDKEPRITQYQHAGDLIPKVGGLFMRKSGKNIIRLQDDVSDAPEIDHLLTNQKGSYYADYYKNLGEKKTIFKSFLKMADTVSETVFKKPLRIAKRVMNVTYHDMARYIINLESQVDKIAIQDKTIIRTWGKFGPDTPHTTKYNKICEGMRIQRKAESKLKGKDVKFNEYSEPSKAFKELTNKMAKQLREKFNLPPVKTGLNNS